MSRKFMRDDKDKTSASSRSNGREEVNKSGPNDKRPNRSRKPKKGKDGKDTALIRGDRNNDPNWYFTNAEVANQASQLSFQSILGYTSAEGYEVPTIMRIPTVLNPGCTYNAEHKHGDLIVDTTTAYAAYVNLPGKAGVNLMAAKLYTTMSSFTGRTASYAPQDVAMMIMSISSIAEISEHIRRMFGLALTYNFWNRTMSLGLLRTMDLDVEDFIANLSVYRMQFNVAMSRINQIPLLDNIGIIKKSRDIYQQIYLDDATAMAQMFYYEPMYYFLLDEVGDSNGSVLRSLTWRGGTANKMSDYLAKLNRMITAVLESSTLNFIYADLLNMANKLKTPMWKFDYLAENYTVMPVYNQNAILQLHNSVAMGEPRDIIEDGKQIQKQVTGHAYYVTGRGDIFCDADLNNVRYNPIFQVTGSRPKFTKTLVDMPTDTPSVEDRLEALRFASLASGYTILGSDIGLASPASTQCWALFNALPDHYIVSYIVYKNVDYAGTTPPTTVSSGSADWTAYPAVMSAFSQFKGAPLYRVADSGRTKWDYVAGDLAFWTEVDYDYIKRLLDITYVGLFDFRVKSSE